MESMISLGWFLFVWGLVNACNLRGGRDPLEIEPSFQYYLGEFYSEYYYYMDLFFLESSSDAEQFQSATDLTTLKNNEGIQDDLQNNGRKDPELDNTYYYDEFYDYARYAFDDDSQIDSNIRDNSVPFWGLDDDSLAPFVDPAYTFESVTPVEELPEQLISQSHCCLIASAKCNPDGRVCPLVSDAVFDPVCGCDGTTYENACEARYYGCNSYWTSGRCQH